MRQIDLDRMVHDRNGDDEDDQQHQHDINQRRSVDFRIEVVIRIGQGTHCHYLPPMAVNLMLLALPLRSSSVAARAPVTKSACRSKPNLLSLAIVVLLPRTMAL